MAEVTEGEAPELDQTTQLLDNDFVAFLEKVVKETGKDISSDDREIKRWHEKYKKLEPVRETLTDLYSSELFDKLDVLDPAIKAQAIEKMSAYLENALITDEGAFLRYAKKVEAFVRKNKEVAEKEAECKAILQRHGGNRENLEVARESQIDDALILKEGGESDQDKLNKAKRNKFKAWARFKNWRHKKGWNTDEEITLKGRVVQAGEQEQSAVANAQGLQSELNRLDTLGQEISQLQGQIDTLRNQNMDMLGSLQEIADIIKDTLRARMKNDKFAEEAFDEMSTEDAMDAAQSLDETYGKTGDIEIKAEVNQFIERVITSELQKRIEAAKTGEFKDELETINIFINDKINSKHTLQIAKNATVLAKSKQTTTAGKLFIASVERILKAKKFN